MGTEPELQDGGRTESRVAVLRAEILHDIRTLPPEEAAEKLARERVAQEKMRTTDAKTGISLIDASRDEVGRMLAYSVRHSLPLAALALDMDDLKKVNDTMGHETGDRIIVEISDLIKELKRGEDLACKYPQGDEFFLFLPGTDLEGAKEFAQRIMKEVPQRIREKIPQIGNHEALGDITVSIGITTFAHSFQNASKLRSEADQALLKAKVGGKNKFEVYESGEDKIKTA